MFVVVQVKFHKSLSYTNWTNWINFPLYHPPPSPSSNCVAILWMKWIYFLRTHTWYREKKVNPSSVHRNHINHLTTDNKNIKRPTFLHATTALRERPRVFKRVCICFVCIYTYKTCVCVDKLWKIYLEQYPCVSSL